MATTNRQISPTFLLALILVLGFVLRATSISFGLPHLYHADEPIVVKHALAFGSGDLNPHFFKIPPLVSYLLFLVYGIFYLAGRLLGTFASPADLEFLFYSDPTLFYLFGRFIFGAFLGTLNIYVLYRLVLRYFDRTRALLAALFLSVCFLHVRDSHYIYADIPLLVVMTAAMAHFLKEAQSWKWHCVSGLWIGLAAAIKYNGAALVIPYFVSVLLSREKARGFYGILMAGLFTLFGFIVFNPFALLDSMTFASEIQAQSLANTGTDWLFHFQHSLAGGLTPVLFACAVAGLAGVLARSEWKRLVLASFAAGYYLILIFASQPYDRYVLPVLPFLCFFAADFLAHLLNRAGIYKTFGLVLLYCALVPNLMKVHQWNRVMGEEDTRTQSLKWIEAHVPSGAAIAMEIEFYMPRLISSREQLETKKADALSQRRLDFEIQKAERGPSYDLYALSDIPEESLAFTFQKLKVPYRLETLRALGIEYVIINRLWENDIHDSFYAELHAAAEKVAVFNPYGTGSEWHALEHPLTGGPFLWEDLQKRERSGQPLEIYRLKP